MADAFLRLHVDGAELKRAVARDVEAGGAPAGAAFGKAFKLAAVTALAGIGVAIGIGAVATKQAVDFQAAMTRIRTQAGATAKDVGVLSDAVLQLSSTRAQQGPQALAEALYHLKSVGLDNVQAMKALRTASDLAAVGGADLESTTNALAGAWRTGIRGATNFGQAAATVNSIIGAGNMTLSDFVSAIGTGILPAAKTWGLGLAQVGGALALMTDEGQNAAEAATRLRMTFALLGAPSAVAAKQLARIGITGLQLGNAMRSPGGLIAAVTLLKTHLDDSGLSATEAAALLARAFGGGRSSATILGLINNLDVLRKKQDQINSSIGKYGANVAAQRATAEAQLHRLGAIFETLGVRIGNALLPPLTGFVSFIVNRVTPEVASFAGTAVRELSNLVPVDAIKRDWNALLVWLGARQAPAPKLFTGNLLNLPKPAALTTGDLIHAPRQVTLPMSVDLLHRPAGGHQQQAGGLTNTLMSTLKGIDWGKLAGVLGAPLGQMLGKAFGWITQHAAILTSQIVTALAGLDWVNIGKAVGGHTLGFAIGLVSSFGSELASPSFWEHHWLDVLIAAISIGGVGKIAGKLLPLIAKIPILRVFAPLLKGIARVGTPIFDAVWGVLKHLGGAFLNGFERVFPEVGGALRKWLQTQLVDRVVGAAGVLRFDAILLGKGLLHGIDAGVSGLGELIAKIIRFIVNPFRSAGSWLLRAGGDVVHGLLTGIRRFMAGISGWVNNTIVQPIIHWVEHFFGISSPSKVMAGIGGHIMTGLFHGIMSGGRNLGGLVRKVFGSIPAALGHMVEKGIVSVASLPGRALKALGGLGSSVLGGIGGLLGKLLGGFSGGGSPNANVALGQKMAAAVGWTGANWSALFNLWQGESGWSARAFNASSGATGIPQSLPGSKMASAGADWRTNPATQIRWGLGYIRSVYGTPLNAYRMWLSRSPHWYRHGGLITEPVMGLGLRSGAKYGFGESGIERVTPGAGTLGEEGMGRLLAALERLIRTTDRTPGRTAQAFGEVLNRAGRRSAYAGAYGG